MHSDCGAQLACIHDLVLGTGTTALVGESDPGQVPSLLFLDVLKREMMEAF